MRLPRRTPYLEAPAVELKRVHDLLYSHKADEQRAGLEWTSLWLNRSACAYAVENTAALVEALLDDAERARAESMTSRLSLNLAIVRFVNSLVDSHQTGMFAAPVKTIAARVGLPLWLVELRHAGTHDELPSLESLRTASEIALRWLDVNFWIPSITEAEKTMRDYDNAKPERTDFSAPASTGFESTLDLMRQRIEAAEKRKNLTGTAALQTSSEGAQPPRLPRGWRMASSDWKPTPIGYVDGRIPDLSL